MNSISFKHAIHQTKHSEKFYRTLASFILLTKTQISILKMATIAGTYKNEKNENLDDFLKAQGKNFSYIMYKG